MNTLRIQSEVFDAGAELRALRETRRDIGAVVCFEGVCRDSHPEQGAASADVQAMELEHYPGMTEQSIAAMVAEAQSRWSLLGVTVIHRVGRLLPGDPIVLVLVASVHRAAAFCAGEFLMDYVKTQAPFWKKETTTLGPAWVDARESDDTALQRWGIDARNASTGHRANAQNIEQGAAPGSRHE
ncbi:MULTISPECIES: molybdenum cofactor biosynthesis protein MoaE [Thiomonas]|uniref:Molybdopterin synthase catalytic subunit n=1 Tax=Thiomonas delicata TaxID=364030 RepID=A0A238D035_THIDL|nr:MULTISPECIES: molybdenum cofactor biosynthesis protein MoaE [Thiomonas]SBP86602.1 Molybdopterin synthase catalytic subunit [Thiomonas delicata]